MATLRRAVMNLNRLVNFTFAASFNGASSASSIAAAPRISKSQLGPLTYRFCSSEIDLSDGESRRRLINRLLYRSKQRGFLELDLVLGKWVEENIHSMDENGIRSLIQVLDLENPDLWKWLTGQEQPPESVSTNPVFSAVCEKVINNLKSYSAPETRVTPGQAWVRGWDDFKRGQGSPVAGNQ
uniref:Succinate dehydrogenase (Quinone) n=1 Tax=Opuntia streptacantha TaxID=393608 RepID=A0A7C8ZUN7_OPUST